MSVVRKLTIDEYALRKRCREFVEEQSCGEWSEADIDADADNLAAFVKREIIRDIEAAAERILSN